jgi:hypothetical protein
LSVLVSPGPGIPHEAEQADGCSPALCALGTRPHAHCICGLPKPIGAALCALCRREGLVVVPLGASDYEDEWDGRRYPSLRRRRFADSAGYEGLLAAILSPAPAPVQARNGRRSKGAVA